MTAVDKRFVPTGEVTTSRRGFFWIGAEPLQTEAGTVERGQMYVVWEQPEEPVSGPAWVLIHGGGGQGTDYLGTPDGRPGWARMLVEAGHTVFVVDRPGHGRSPYHPEVLGEMGPPPTAERLMPIFVPPADSEEEGGEPANDQWPGGTAPGDQVFDQWLAPAGPMPVDAHAMHALERDRLAELLDMVGPAVVVTHSAGGPGTFAAVDARPDKVAALIAIETVGPPFQKGEDGGLDLRWGVSTVPLTFDPPVADPAELELVTEVNPEFGSVPITLQHEPARRLQNLARTPIAVVTGEASPFLAFDRHLVEFLRQGGCDVELLRLAELDVRGNGHGMMLERNNEEVLEVLSDWVSRKLETI
jgi:pimeloyl-ACP methyl ester carboxylesterase